MPNQPRNTPFVSIAPPNGQGIIERLVVAEELVAPDGFVDGTSIMGTGKDGDPLRAPGGGGGAVSPGYVYKPGGTDTGPRVFASGAAHNAARAAARTAAGGGFVTVVVDSSVLSPAPIPTGVYDMTGVTLAGPSVYGGSTVEFGVNATMQHLVAVEGIDVIQSPLAESAVAPIQVAALEILELRWCSIRSLPVMGSTIIAMATASVLRVGDGVNIQGFNALSSAITVDEFAMVEFYLYGENCALNDAAIRSGAATITIYAQASSAKLSTNQWQLTVAVPNIQQHAPAWAWSSGNPNAAPWPVYPQSAGFRLLDEATDTWWECTDALAPTWVVSSRGASGIVFSDLRYSPSADPASPTVLDDEFNGLALDPKWSPFFGSGALSADLAHSGVVLTKDYVSDCAAGYTQAFAPGASAFTFEARLNMGQFQIGGAVFSSSGIGITDGTRYAFGAILSDGGNPKLGIQYWSDATTFVGDSKTALTLPSFSPVVANGFPYLLDLWIRLARSGNDLIVTYSPNGYDFGLSTTYANVLAGWGAISGVGPMMQSAGAGSTSLKPRYQYFRKVA